MRRKPCFYDIWTYGAYYIVNRLRANPVGGVMNTSYVMRQFSAVILITGNDVLFDGFSFDRPCNGRNVC